jgi:hypothetical protein
VSRGTTVSRLALRELWMSFRLFVILVAYMAVGVGVSVVAAPLPDVLLRLALGLGAATAVAGAVAAWSIAVERGRGRAGWLVARDVPRGTYLNGWFVTLVGATAIGHLTATVLGWFAAAAVAPRLEPSGYVAAAGATLAAAVAAVALGMLLGTMLSPLPATAVTLALVALAGTAVLANVVPPDVVPAAGAFATLGGLAGESGTGSALVAAGLALAATAVLMGLGRVTMERVEL